MQIISLKEQRSLTLSRHDSRKWGYNSPDTPEFSSLIGTHLLTSLLFCLILDDDQCEKLVILSSLSIVEITLVKVSFGQIGYWINVLL